MKRHTFLGQILARLARQFSLAIAIIASASAAHGYVLLPPPASAFTMNFDMSSKQFQTLGYGLSSWSSLAQGAASEWNGVGIGSVPDKQFFTATTNLQVGDPCTASGSINEVRFDNDDCGYSWGDAVAITHSWTINGKRIKETMVFDVSLNWDAYPGQLRSVNGQGWGPWLYDFYRVAIHEFGHAAGLDHPDEAGQVVNAIMNATVSDVDGLQTDDINGAHAIRWSGGGVADTQAPSVPYGVSVTPQANSQVLISWSPSSDNVGVSAYKLYRGRTLVATVSSGTSFVDGPLASATTYNYSIVACDAAGNCSDDSVAVTYTTGGPALADLLIKGSADGRTGWTQASTIGDPIIVSEASGGWYAYFAGYNDASDVIYRDIAIPADATLTYIQYYYYIKTNETSSKYIYDTLKVELLNPATSARLGTVDAFSNLDAGKGWVLEQYDISAFRGQTVRLKFTASTDSGQSTAFYIADIAVMASGSAASGLIPQAGWWWNPAEGGRGFTIEQQGGKIFMAGYLYDASGRATWYAAGPAAYNNGRFSSPLTAYQGGQTLNGTYHLPSSTYQVGDMNIKFSDPAHAVMTWPGGTLALQRYDIVAGGAGAAIPAGTPEAGWWWSSAEGGRGYSIEIQNGTMFLAGYMYDATSTGNPIWYASGPTRMSNASTYVGTWQEYGKGQTLSGAYKLAQVVNNNVGSIKVEFTSTKTAILTLPNGKRLSIERYKF